MNLIFFEMAAGINLIKQLLIHIESYENEVGNDSLREFSFYLKDKVLDEESVKKARNKDLTDFKDYKSNPEIEFSTLLTNLYRFAKHYIKKAFSETMLRTIDEFGFLASLFKENSMLKNELINTHILETSSGSEILKRLIKSDLIVEFADKNDKRAKRVSLTEKGRIELFKAFAEMHKVAKIVTGNLTNKELCDALMVLNKLNYFHHHIHEADKQTSLNELATKYLN